MIELNATSQLAIAIVSRLAEAHAHQEEANIGQLAEAAKSDVATIRPIVEKLCDVLVIAEGFDEGGYLLTREPGAINVLEVATPFEPLLQDDCRRIARAMRPEVQSHFRAITFAACATDCPTDKQEPESGDCPRSQLGLNNP